MSQRSPPASAARRGADSARPRDKSRAGRAARGVCLVTADVSAPRLLIGCKFGGVSPLRGLGHRDELGHGGGGSPTKPLGSRVRSCPMAASPACLSHSLFPTKLLPPKLHAMALCPTL